MEVGSEEGRVGIEKGGKSESVLMGSVEKGVRECVVEERVMKRWVMWEGARREKMIKEI